MNDERQQRSPRPKTFFAYFLGPVLLFVLIPFTASCSETVEDKPQYHEALKKSCDQLSPELTDLNAPGKYDYDKKQLHKWFTPSQPPKAVVLSVHGLNNKPDSMDQLNTWLMSKGLAVLRVALSGHRGDIEEFKDVDHTTWQKNIYQAYCHLKSRFPQIPVFLVANSLGALNSLQVASIKQTATPVQFKAQILLAPAIALKGISRLVRILRLLGPDFVVPSMTPEAYRANRGTPNAAYQALFTQLDLLKDQGHWKHLSKTPSVILMDPEDELVSKDKMEDLLTERGLEEWEIIYLSTKNSTLDRSYHHLIFNREGLGHHEWRRMLSHMIRFLEEKGGLK